MITSTASSTLATMSDCAMKWPKPRADVSPMTYSYCSTKLIGTRTHTVFATPPSE